MAAPSPWASARCFLKSTAGRISNWRRCFPDSTIFGRALTAYLLILIYVLLWSLLPIVPGIIAAISYSMTYFIMADDPHISATDAMRRSREMMMGHKTEYFWLMLSFIGWFIISCFTCGLGFFFLSSYTTMASAIFYRKLKGDNTIIADTL